MARTTTIIEKSIAANVATTNPSIDTEKGPIPEIFIIPQAAQLNNVESQIDDLSKRYSLDYTLTRNNTIVDLYGANHGLRKSAGKPATGSVVFYTYTRLQVGENIAIPVGTVVTTADPSIAYQTTATVTFYGDKINTYYNAAKRRYEISAQIESLGTGDLFDVPPLRINQIRSSLNSEIAGVENRAKVTGSTVTETNAAFGARIRNKFNGTAQGSGSGILQLIQTYDPSRINDVYVVFNSDLTLFKRISRYAAWDIYVVGEDIQQYEEEFTGDGFTTSFVLDSQPVRTITSVTVNRVPVSYSLVKDVTDATSNSSKSTDRVILAVPPALNSEINVQYEYDKLMGDIQTYVGTAGHDLFNSDILIREAIPVSVTTNIEIQVLSSFDDTQAISDTFAVVSSFLNPGTFVDGNILYPDALRNLISGTVGGISGVVVKEFTRVDGGTLPIEAIEMLPIEYPVAEDALITITARM